MCKVQFKRFKHDCSNCRFLGYDNLNKADWYDCSWCGSGTIVARTGHQPSEYWSMPIETVKAMSPVFQGNFVEEARRLITLHNL